ncbi:MAG: hypothetical protein ACT4NV_19695 [Rhodoferax sp.]
MAEGAPHKTLRFAYISPQWQTVSYRGDPNVIDTFSGFSGLGSLMVDHVGSVFSQRSVHVERVQIRGAQGDIRYSNPTTPTQTDSAWLVLTPDRSSLTSREARQGADWQSTHGAVSYEFDAKLMDARREKTLWQGRLHTSVIATRTQSGPSGGRYDASMARSMLETLAARLAADGLI